MLALQPVVPAVVAQEEAPSTVVTLPSGTPFDPGSNAEGET